MGGGGGGGRVRAVIANRSPSRRPMPAPAASNEHTAVPATPDASPPPREAPRPKHRTPTLITDREPTALTQSELSTATGHAAPPSTPPRGGGGGQEEEEEEERLPWSHVR